MTFLAANRLWLLLVVAALAVAYVVLQQRRRHYAVRFTNLDLLASVAPRRPGWRRHLPAAVLALGLASMVVALARPARAERIARDEAIVMLAIDVSASMAATDVEPSRLEAAIEAASEFVADMPDGLSVGLVAFDGAARVVTPPTTEHDDVIAAIERLETGPGTATGDAILTALDAIEAALADTDDRDAPSGPSDREEEPPPAAIVLISDGTPTVGTPVEDATEAAAEAGIPVSAIAYGTLNGTVTVQGQTIPVPVDVAAMEAIAEQTGGRAFTAESAGELDAVYADIGARVGYDEEQREIGRAFVGVGLAALVAAAGASLLWTGRIL